MENEEKPDREGVGKIARLPSKIREELNLRIFENQYGSQILPWLNAQPEVAAIVGQFFNGHPVSENNLSEYKRNAYQKWKERRERVGHLKTLSEYAFDLAKAGGGSISEGGAAIAGGKILELLEGATDARVEALIDSLVSLRHAEIAGQKIKQKEVELKQRDRSLQLEEKKFQRQTAELFLKWHDDKRIRDIAEGKEKKDVKMDKLVQLVFGEPSK
jgi:hypothetical protein